MDQQEITWLPEGTQNGGMVTAANMSGWEWEAGGEAGMFEHFTGSAQVQTITIYWKTLKRTLKD